MKIITFLLFSFCLVLSAHGYDVTFTDASGLKYGYTSGNDTLTLLSGNGSGITGDLVIPSHLSYNSKPYVVGAIDDRAFAGNKNLTSISIPSSVTSISHTAFYSCTGLKAITVDAANKNYCSDASGVLYETTTDGVPVCLVTYPSASSATSYQILDGAVTICSFSFYGVRDLKTLTIPSTVQCFGLFSNMNDALYMCPCLQSITVADSSDYYCSVDGVLFDRDTTALITYPAAKSETSYVIPSTVTNVYSNAFTLASNLVSITIPESVTRIGTSGTFPGCLSLTHFIVDGSNTHYTTEDGILFNTAKTELVSYPAGKTATGYTVPSATVDAYAFCAATHLTSVTLPAAVTSIGNEAFYECMGLSEIHADNPQPVDISANGGTFDGVNLESCKLYVPAGSTEAYSNAEEWGDFTNIGEETADAVTHPQGQQPSVSVASGRVTLSNMSKGEPLHIYDMTGKQVYSRNSISSEEEISLPHGAYVVKYGKASQKIMIP